ncbi:MULTISPECIES: glycosyltransferase family 2 protein [Asticcacaulis]|uniref:glycosyltransferase family 2 protein n=1 Tax=Asticcacaulis TaxID=76890 RepID=UPI001AE4D447|nr:MULTISPECIES: glycosyltransferase family 2 protein [Asticcacaulis]MBP2157592.1 dolichol-phosphate mannosyltransferase [Asticcacaulis solisilvae]MDR6798637.1 dolichol-phosphate mannosyltransferase [Asticcacaulis sp. BE141]
MSPTVSVVVPVYNEEGAAVQVASEIESVFSKTYGEGGFEIIMVDDRSTDASYARLSEAKQRIPALRVLRHEHNSGKSAAIRSGVMAARAGIIVTVDGDGQNPPADAARLAMILRDAPPHVGLVAGQRRARQDTASKKWASRWANGIRKSLLNDNCDDTACGLKAIRRDVFLRLPFFDQLHRYLPALVNREGFTTLLEPVDDRARTTGQSKYTNIGRLAVALTDLPGVMWLNRRLRKPGKVSEAE